MSVVRICGARLLGVVAGLGLPLEMVLGLGMQREVWSSGLPGDPCPPLLAQRHAPPTGAAQAAPTVPDLAMGPSATGDYRERLRPTPLGWARRDHWCVWIEPGASEGPAALWDGRWRQAVEAALARWQAVLSITVVTDPARAQVRLLRRKPPLQNGRASHGRAELALVEVQRGQPGQAAGPWQIEPEVRVQLSPGQGAAAMQATALHELGHAFGLWGHSDQPGDALATVPGSQPVLELSPRDRATLRWLQDQPGLAAPEGVTPAAAPRDAGPAPAAPGAN